MVKLACKLVLLATRRLGCTSKTVDGSTRHKRIDSLSSRGWDIAGANTRALR